MHVRISPAEGGLKLTSFIKCEDIRSVSRDRLRQFHGVASARTMTEVETRVRILLNL
jgi:mRNA interferase MazF